MTTHRETASELTEDPVLRMRSRFWRTTNDGKTVLHVETWVDPGGGVTPHIHPAMEERFEVIEGQPEFLAGRRWKVAESGETVLVSPGTRHAFRNRSGDVAHFVCHATPPSTLQEFLEDAAALSRAGGITRRALPRSIDGLLQAAVMAHHYRDMVTLLAPLPPPAIQRVVIPALARAGERRGYRAGSIGRDTTAATRPARQPVTRKDPMKLTVFGATGGIGGHVVRQALAAGHHVTAVVRDPARFDVSHPALEVAAVPGLTDPEVLRAALEGSDVAISGVGPRGRKAGPVASSATRGMLHAIEASGVRRFVAVSAVPVGPVPDGESFLNRRILLPFISAVARDVYADLAEMEDEIRRSTTEWTIVRPPRLVNKPLTGKYRTVIGANVPRGYAISRADVAHLMLAVLDNPATVRQAIGIAY